MDKNSRPAAVALVLMALLGITLVFAFPGSPEQDSEYHFLMARTAWGDPSYFVNVWARPLYTAVFATPALLGYIAARIFAVVLGVGVAWQTWRLARDMELDRAWLVIPLLLCQPVFFELFPDLLTEPLFAFVFVVALRWHLKGWRLRGMLAASLLPLARPEGVFICLLWGCWVLWDDCKSFAESSGSRGLRLVRSLFAISLLLSGVCIWWLAALCITGDPLFIVHNWPATWHTDMYGHASLWSYAARSYEFTGELLLLPFLVGLVISVMRRQFKEIVSAVLLLFVLHTIFRAFGLFGEAGYPRYMVSVAPAVAVITLQGWNTIAGWLRGCPPLVGRAAGIGVITLSLVQGFLYLNSFTWARDAMAINEMSAWLREHPEPRGRLIWSNARMCVVDGIDLSHSPTLNGRGNDVLAVLRDAPSHTLVFWDNHCGPDWFGLTGDDIARNGYQVLRTHRYSLGGFVSRDMHLMFLSDREVELSLLYKP